MNWLVIVVIKVIKFKWFLMFSINKVLLVKSILVFIFLFIILFGFRLLICLLKSVVFIIVVIFMSILVG